MVVQNMPRCRDSCHALSPQAVTRPSLRLCPGTLHLCRSGVHCCCSRCRPGCGGLYLASKCVPVRAASLARTGGSGLSGPRQLHPHGSSPPYHLPGCPRIRQRPRPCPRSLCWYSLSDSPLPAIPCPVCPAQWSVETQDRPHKGALCHFVSWRSVPLPGKSPALAHCSSCPRLPSTTDRASKASSGQDQ